MVPAEAPRHGIREMRIIATGMLVAMAAVFVVANAWDETWPALGYVKAFAEAAMVGGLADWFAVTALFRHPPAQQGPDRRGAGLLPSRELPDPQGRGAPHAACRHRRRHRPLPRQPAAR